MDDLLFVANPAARGFTGGLYRRIKSLLGRHHEVTHAWPRSGGEVQQVVADASTRGVGMVVVMGGDGVVHHAAQALVSGSTTLGIVPAGTANVLAKIIGLPDRPLAAARIIAEGGAVTRIPVARVTLTGDHGSTTHYATFNVGLGYDADVVSSAEAGPDRKARLGVLHYAGNALETVWSYRKRPPTMTVDVEGVAMPGVMTAIQVHHTYTYFGRVPMVVGPDEPLSGIVVEQLSVRRATSMALRSFRGRIEPTLAINQFAGAATLTVVGDGVPVQADGEMLGHASGATVTLVTDALPIVTGSKKERLR